MDKVARKDPGPIACFVLITGLLAFSACASRASVVSVRTAAPPASQPPPPASWTTPHAHYHPSLSAIAQDYVSDMTLNEELGQLFIAALSGTDFNANNSGMVEQQYVGGILLYTVNMASESQTRQLIATAQAHSQIPLLVTTDEEGGYVDRLEQFYGFRPSATMIGNTNSPEFARQQGYKTGKDMATLGFNMDFAPDVDVQLVDGPDQITRTFGTTPTQVTSLAGSYMNGMQSAGVITTLKHYPGLGDATSDAHQDLPVIHRTRAEIESVEFAPYRQLISTGQVQMIMATDVLMPAFDPKMPAELSPILINGVLRHSLGYNGVVVTDALYMQGVADRYSMPEAATLAIEAGDDLLVGAFTPYQIGAMISALKAALQSGALTKARIDQSVERILTLKMRMGILPVPSPVLPVPAVGSMSPKLGSWPNALLPDPSGDAAVPSPR
jgi:beta-N-acetylhexosaminidase